MRLPKNNKNYRITKVLIPLALLIMAIIVLLVFITNINFQRGKILNPMGSQKEIEKVAFLIKNRNISFLSISQKDNYYELTLSGDVIVLFPKQTDIDKNLDTLQFLLDSLKIEGRRVKTIDLRFNKPIIKEIK